MASFVEAFLAPSWVCLDFFEFLGKHMFRRVLQSWLFSPSDLPTHPINHQRQQYLPVSIS